jgi:eukaryotic translation initiation factor 2C
MKINLRLRGFNWTLPAQDLPNVDSTTMVVGADVTHPGVAGKGSEIPPSIAAVVAEVSSAHNLFSTEIREQEGRVEPITDLCGKSFSTIYAIHLNS